MDIRDISGSSVVICDDSLVNVLLLSKLVESEGIRQVRPFTDPRQALQYLREHGSEADLLILDIEMPHLSGIEVMAALESRFQGKHPFAILVITGMQDRAVRHQALVAGANDFLDKPFDQMEVVLRIRNLLRAQRFLKAQTTLAQELETEVRKRTEELAALNEALEHKVATRTHELLRAEKMASVGRLAAGIAHEINNPVGFVQSNLGSLKTYGNRLIELIDALGACTDATRHEQMRQEADFDFLRGDMIELIEESRVGLARVSRIVQKLMDFSYVDQSEIQDSDLNTDLENSLQVAWHEIRENIAVMRDYGVLPRVRCVPAQINQVFFNLITNAVQAMAGTGTLTLATRAEPDWVTVSIGDTGSGMSEEALTRIFDPFYTTRPVGQGMGLGLSESYDIVNKHGGRLNVESRPGHGTTFHIRLPVAGRAPWSPAQQGAPGKVGVRGTAEEFPE